MTTQTLPTLPTMNPAQFRTLSRNQAAFNNMCYRVNDQIKATMAGTYSQFWAEVDNALADFSPRPITPVETITVRGRKVKVSEATQHIVDDGQLSMFNDSGAFAMYSLSDDEFDALFDRMDANGNLPADVQPKPRKARKATVKIAKPAPRVKLVAKTPALAPAVKRQQLKNTACLIGLGFTAMLLTLLSVLS